MLTNILKFFRERDQQNAVWMDSCKALGATEEQLRHILEEASKAAKEAGVDPYFVSEDVREATIEYLHSGGLPKDLSALISIPQCEICDEYCDEACEMCCSFTCEAHRNSDNICEHCQLELVLEDEANEANDEDEE